MTEQSTDSGAGTGHVVQQPADQAAAKPPPVVMAEDLPLGRDDILRKTDLPRERVEVPEWGGHVYVRTLTGDERDQWEALLLGKARKKGGEREVIMQGARSRLAAMAICDEDGKSQFTLADAPLLGKLHAAALARVFEVGSRLSGLTEEDIEELVGESEGTPVPGPGSE